MSRGAPLTLRTGLALGALGALLCAGCPAGEPTLLIVRRVGGEQRTGTFVSPFAYEWFMRGELAAGAGDWPGAAEAFRMALAGPDEDPLVLARLADALDHAGDRAAADEALAEGERIDECPEAIWLVRGAIAERHDQRDTAIAAYTRAASCAPQSADGPLALAALLERAGQSARADAVLQDCVTRAGGHGAGAARARLALALRGGDARAIADALETLGHVAPARGSDVEAAVRATLSADDRGLAARLFDRLPRGLGDVALRARSLVRAGRSTEAEALLATGSPDAFGGLTETARLFLEVGRADRAEELAAAALATTDEPEAAVVLGRARLALGEYGGAVGPLARVRAGATAFVDARLALATALDGMGMPGLAREALARTLTTDDDVRVREALAAARLAAGDLDRALDALGTHDDVRSQVARARLLDRGGRPADAARAWASVSVDDPGLDAPTRERVRAERWLARDDVQRGIATLRALVRSTPTDALARARLAELLQRTGDASGAAREATAARSLDGQLRARLDALLAPR